MRIARVVAVRGNGRYNRPPMVNGRSSERTGNDASELTQWIFQASMAANAAGVSHRARPAKAEPGGSGIDSALVRRVVDWADAVRVREKARGRSRRDTGAAAKLGRTDWWTRSLGAV